MITLGGNAELELYDSADPFSEGILFSVMPPKKSWKNISNLSGGEKTLSSLALVFALHTYKVGRKCRRRLAARCANSRMRLQPTPIYLLDEVDAALDFRNVSIVANYIKARCAQQAQFIVISLRNVRGGSFFPFPSKKTDTPTPRDRTSSSSRTALSASTKSITALEAWPLITPTCPRSPTLTAPRTTIRLTLPPDLPPASRCRSSPLDSSSSFSLLS